MSADPACISLRWSLALLDGLVGGGIERLVLSPGSRSTPIVLAAQRQPRLSLTPVLDERSAAFFALGLASASRRPVALLCTSGSAPAHWLPAVIEAHASGTPLVLLSADRPPELRAWGANQTIDQIRLFGVFVLEFHDPGRPDDRPQALEAMRALGERAAAVSKGRRPGPVHINLSFPEPLVPEPGCETKARAPRTAGSPRIAPSALMLSGPSKLDGLLKGRGIIVCGPGHYPAELVQSLLRCADELALPILADPLSGLRFGPAGAACSAGYDSLLRNPGAARTLRPDWVLRLGGAPVSKTLLDWLKGIPAILIDPGGQWRDPNHDARVHLDTDPAQFCDWLACNGLAERDEEWQALWTGAEGRLNAIADGYLSNAAWCEPHLIRALLDRLPQGSALFSASSMPVRQLDIWSGTRLRPIRVFCNRGASGIDGNVSTLAGLNAAGAPTLGLLGDLALFHDLSGLLLAERNRLPLIVISNGGGRIFDYLPQQGVPGFEALWRTPVPLEIRKVAGLFGVPYHRTADANGFQEVLEEVLEESHMALIEVLIDAETSLDLHRDFWQLVRRETVISS